MVLLPFMHLQACRHIISDLNNLELGSDTEKIEVRPKRMFSMFKIGHFTHNLSSPLIVSLCIFPLITSANLSNFPLFKGNSLYKFYSLLTQLKPLLSFSCPVFSYLSDLRLGMGQCSFIFQPSCLFEGKLIIRKHFNLREAQYLELQWEFCPMDE